MPLVRIDLARGKPQGSEFRLTLLGSTSTHPGESRDPGP